jgi:hypothetical protein
VYFLRSLKQRFCGHNSDMDSAWSKSYVAGYGNSVWIV